MDELNNKIAVFFESLEYPKGDTGLTTALSLTHRRWERESLIILFAATRSKHYMNLSSLLHVLYILSSVTASFVNVNIQ